MAKPNNAGELRARFKFQRRQDVPDGYGNTEGAWQDLGIARQAKKSPTRGGEAVQAARVAGTAMFDLWFRYDPETLAVTTDDRAVELVEVAGGWTEGEAFNIRFGPEDMDGDRRWLLVQVERGVAT